MIIDPILQEMLDFKEKVAREANHDLHTLCERLRAAEREHPQRMSGRRPVVPPRKGDRPLQYQAAGSATPALSLRETDDAGREHTADDR